MFVVVRGFEEKTMMLANECHETTTHLLKQVGPWT